MAARHIVDLHIHSRFSRACSRDLLIPNIAAIGSRKGITLVGTGDFTHPAWYELLQQELKQREDGFYEAKGVQTYRPIAFVPTTEIACIYSKGGKVRRLHLIVVAPSLEVVARVNERLAAIGNLAADGRPILGLDARELVRLVIDVSPDCLVIPAHAWTPWFSVFGSKSGFDSLSECFEELTPHIAAIETGLSSDPEMNWRLSALDTITLISNSDAHSLDNLGREATIIESDGTFTYAALAQALRRQDGAQVVQTIEFYPEEGKYHVDGHAVCGIRLLPEETRRHGGRCPACGRAVTVGVLSRVNDLADRSLAAARKTERPPFVYSVPLREIIAAVLEVGKKSKAVDRIYCSLVPVLGSEFEVLLDLPLEAVRDAGFPTVAEAVDNVRRGAVRIEPGYDGIFGTVKVAAARAHNRKQQAELFT